MKTKSSDSNEENREAWETNANVWDAKMGEEGNDFFRILQWPVIRDFLGMDHWEGNSLSPEVLDIACGNGLTSRKLALAGAEVTAIDFSANLIDLAQGHPNHGGRIDYRVVDVTDKTSLLAMGEGRFDSALCNMALFDIAEIEPLFQALPILLKPKGCFVFSLTHPAFNNASCVHTAEEQDLEGVITTTYSVKVSRYLRPWQAKGVALRDQPRAQIYFERPIEYYLNLGFRNGFILDGFAERAFPPETPPTKPLSWGGQFSEIPPVLVARMRLV
ncbi:MAG TPA: class I SAM-dependent methyltransferase [Anaerolineales bacterium]